MTKKQWETTRKKLPTNYVQLTFQKLVNDGVTCTYASVYDVIRGKNKKPLLTVKVWENIRLVLKEHQALVKKAKRAKTLL